MIRIRRKDEKVVEMLPEKWVDRARHRIILSKLSQYFSSGYHLPVSIFYPLVFHACDRGNSLFPSYGSSRRPCLSVYPLYVQSILNCSTLDHTGTMAYTALPLHPCPDHDIDPCRSPAFPRNWSPYAPLLRNVPRPCTPGTCVLLYADPCADTSPVLGIH
jgi:hypothetical protein